MSNLSPAALAVLDAFGKHPLHNDHISDGLLYGALPAALRAAAGYMFPNDTAQQCYDRILAIAAELEKQ